MDISITDIMQIDDPKNYKLHLGCRNESGEHPLDLYLEDVNNWKEWNEWRGSKNDWNRDYIFSLIEFYPKSNTWLFGGIFQVIERKKNSYVLKEIERFSKFTGRLLFNFSRYQGMRGRAFLFESYINDITVNQIFEQKYIGEIFPGYDQINHDFSVIEPIFKLEKGDWKIALENVKGIYLITDKKTGKFYIGSAYGNSGIWARWANYIGTLHGWNDQLIKLIKDKGPEYVRENFRFSILELFPMYSLDEKILAREKYWKEKLMTRVHGYNSN